MPGSDPITTARALLARGVHDRIFPAAVAEVGNSAGVLWREPFGSLTFAGAAAPADVHTIFDLASLTKPLATTSVLIQLVSEGALALDHLVPVFFEEWRGPDRAATTVQDLLEHTAGLAARLVDQPPEGRREFEHEICTMKLEYARRTGSIYSDLGFILLGFIAADRGGDSLDSQFERLLRRLATTAGLAFDPSTDMLGFTVPIDQRERAAPTSPLDDDVRRGRVLAGEVHDSYAYALGGVAGHAGLFGTAAAVGTLARGVLRAARGDDDMPSPFSPDLVALATRKSSVPGSSRALGWDRMLVTSSCGRNLSASAFGHVGFTGTSLWIDPLLDRYFVLLTNRAEGPGTPAGMQAIRQAFHDAVARL